MGSRKKPDWLKRFDRRKKNANKEPPKRRSRSVPREVRAKSDGCEVCGAKAEFFIAHHIIPLRKGGDDSITNAIRLCSRCEDIAHERIEGPNTIPYFLLRTAAKHGVIGGVPRTTLLAAIEGQRQQETAERARELGNAGDAELEL
jgi:hypothetical protein